MRKLQNIHPIDIAPGEVGVTVRRGDKWANITHGEALEIYSGDVANQTKIGEGKVTNVMSCRFSEIPARLVEMEHEKTSRTYSSLLESMKRAYNEPKFKETDQVVVMTYLRLF